MAKKYLINGDVLNPEPEGSAQSHNNSFQTNYNFKMFITSERKVPQRSDASQIDHKSRGYPSKTSLAFTMQKSDTGAYALQAPWASDFLLDFLKSGSTVLV